jgi:NAD-reducing hydrogenase large subunit
MSVVETVSNPEQLTRIAIDPVTRVEGHGKVTLLVDQDHRVRQARLHIVEFRGFEKFIQGRPYWELPVIVQRLCGICPVSHHLAAAKAVDQLVGARVIPPTAEKIRRLMHLARLCNPMRCISFIWRRQTFCLSSMIPLLTAISLA